MKIDVALLCPECDEIFNADAIRCPCCLNDGGLRLDRIIEAKHKKAGADMKASVLFNEEDEIATLIIGAMQKSYKIKERFFKVDYSAGTLLESKEDKWKTCEEINNET